MGDTNLRGRHFPILVKTIQPLFDVTAVVLAIGVVPGQFLLNRTWSFWDCSYARALKNLRLPGLQTRKVAQHSAEVVYGSLGQLTSVCEADLSPSC